MARIPRKVALGNGYWVRVLTVPQKTIRAAVGLSALLPHEHKTAGQYDGLWNPTQEDVSTGGPAGVIYIYNRLPDKRKWQVYWHELTHAIADIGDWDGQT